MDRWIYGLSIVARIVHWIYGWMID